MAFVTFSALIIHLLFPLAPPRMIPGFVDTMREFGPSIYPANAVDGAANQIAAMPSLHFGWAMIEAMAVVSVLKSRWRWLIVIHPALMTLSIIATANHWWIDAAAAALIVLGAVGVWRLVQAWVGDRRFSLRRMRFESTAAIEHAPSSAAIEDDPSTATIDDVPATATIDDVPATATIEHVPSFVPEPVGEPVDC
jgi:hypothetical protein